MDVEWSKGMVCFPLESTYSTHGEADLERRAIVDLDQKSSSLSLTQVLFIEF
jgi:hypothetical protein